MWSIKKPKKQTNNNKKKLKTPYPSHIIDVYIFKASVCKHYTELGYVLPFVVQNQK